MAEPIFANNGRISVWKVKNSKRESCTYEIKDGRECKRSPHDLFMVERYNSVLAATVCHTHLDIVIRAAEKDALAKNKNPAAEPQHVNARLGNLELTDFFDPPKISRMRFLDCVDFKGESLDDLVVASAGLSRDQYLVVPKDFHIVPGGIGSFRKKGLFLDIKKIDRKSLRQAARLAIEGMDASEVYAGMRNMDNIDNTRREYALVTLIEGAMIQNLLGEPGRKRGLRFVDDEGEKIRIDLEEKYLGRGAFCFYVPSSSISDKFYRVELAELRTRHSGTKRQRGRYGIRFECTCEASLKDALTGSDVNSGGRQYANKKVRPCKHAYAALAYLETHKFLPVNEPRTPVKPSKFARGFNAKLRTRVLHGNDHLRRIEQEVILMRAIAPKLLGYNRMFDK